MKYLNNIVEQVHRFIKRLTKLGMGFFSFETAWRTVQRYKMMHIIWKEQARAVDNGDISCQVEFIATLFGVAASSQSKGLCMLSRFTLLFCNRAHFLLIITLDACRFRDMLLSFQCFHISSILFLQFPYLRIGPMYYNISRGEIAHKKVPQKLMRIQLYQLINTHNSLLVLLLRGNLG